MALALDVDDMTRMTGSGLHMANLGGIWQAVVAAGLDEVRVRAGVLTVDPRLPAGLGGKPTCGCRLPVSAAQRRSGLRRPPGGGRRR